MNRWHSCNVLHVGASTRQVWQFDARDDGFTLSREETGPTSGPLPGRLVARSWRSLWQPRLNVAWLPPESVFLRVAQLPQSSFEETVAMVELQLEKLSPIPVTQVVWSLQLLPQSAGSLQTAIVVLAERKAVEVFLGQLEGQRYLADRLEIPVLDQLSATPVAGDGAWIYPEAGGKNTALVAWWYGRALQNLNFVMLPATGDRAASLKEQLTQMAWAGELEGWLTAPPPWHLVADAATAAEWEPLLRQGLAEPIVVTAPLKPAELAALTAKRAAQADRKVNLLPAEFSTRYQQQFVDRLWLRGLFATGAIYAGVVLIYFVALFVLSTQAGRMEDAVKASSNDYTNAMELKTRYQTLKGRQELKFAALECWNVTAELMPQSVTLDSFTFSEGRKVSFRGTAPADQSAELLNFNAAMRKVTVNNQPLFDPAKGEPFSSQAVGPGDVGWSFGFELRRGEAQ